MGKVVWPVMGVIYAVSTGIAALHAKYDVDLGFVTFLAWIVVLAGAATFVAWALYHILAAFTGRGLGA